MSYARRSIPHRCIKCRARKTLAKLWRKYQRPPKCRVCGYYRLTPQIDRLPSKWGRKHRCKCEGYHFPHRRGSKYCEHNARYAEHWHERHEARAA